MTRAELENLAFNKTPGDYKALDADGAMRLNYVNPKSGNAESWPISALPVEHLLRLAGLSKDTFIGGKK